MKHFWFAGAILFGLGGCALGGVDRGNFGPFERSLNTKSYGYTVIEDPTKLAPTLYVERFEVRPGDCGGQVKYWSDCRNDRERSELKRSKPRKANINKTYWYGWSFFVPNDWINIYPTKVTLGQFHEAGSGVAWMFQNSRGGLGLDNHVQRQANYSLIEPKEFKGRWHRIEIQVKWSNKSDGDGFFRVWVNGEQKVDYSGQTMSGLNHVYFKYGVYRSFMSRYEQANNGKEAPGQTVFYANMRRANSREGLLPQR